jgi:DNA polymerase-3 subunit gamma/tau
MRELLDTAQYMPVAGRFKVYIIDEVHMLSRHAFNSMLKTLEEPPEHVKFILATTDPQRLPVTVLSRCLQFNLTPQPPAVVAGHLKRVLEAEGVPYEEGALLQLGKAAAGSLRDSLSLLDQAIAHGGGRVAAAQVAQMLGSLGGDLVWPLLERVVAGDGKGAIAEAERIAGRSVSYDAALEELAALLHRVALEQAGAGPTEGDTDAARVKDIAARIDPGRVQVMYQVAVLGRRDLPLAPDEFAGFTMTLLRMISFMQPGEAPRPREGTEAAARPAMAQATRASAPVEAPVRSAPATAASKVPPTAPAASTAAPEFDGDWPALVERLNLTGHGRHGRAPR